MESRTLGRSGVKVSAISLGTEYLIHDSREAVVPIIQEAIARGVNYFDLWYAEPTFRDNMGVAFREHRNKVMLSAHLGSTDKDGQYEKTTDLTLATTFYHDFLKRFRTDYVDVLFLHNIDSQADYDRLMAPDGFADFAQRQRREGTARLIGFSGHTVATSLQAVESGLVDVLMFPVNLAGHAVPGKRDLLLACATRGVGVVAMKPFAGGKLLQRERTVAMENWQVGGAPRQVEKKVPITPAQCLAYVLAQSGVSTVVPGAKDLGELAAAQAYWETPEKERDYSPILADFQQYTSGECVYCNHCLPCPALIDIGQTIRLYETAVRGMTETLRGAYNAMAFGASDCLQCGNCEGRCPFGVRVISTMEHAAALFGH